MVRAGPLPLALLLSDDEPVRINDVVHLSFIIHVVYYYAILNFGKEPQELRVPM